MHLPHLCPCLVSTACLVSMFQLNFAVDIDQEVSTGVKSQKRLDVLAFATSPVIIPGPTVQDHTEDGPRPLYRFGIIHPTPSLSALQLVDVFLTCFEVASGRWNDEVMDEVNLYERFTHLLFNNFNRFLWHEARHKERVSVDEASLFLA